MSTAALSKLSQGFLEALARAEGRAGSEPGRYLRPGSNIPLDNLVIWY